MFLQMPIWLALYRMLSSTGELYQQPFIHGWINDLTAADQTHVLPAALIVTMFIQARLQPTAPSTDPAQKMQQRMMQYGLPLMFGVMSFFFPAGLALYIFTNTCLSAAHSIYMNKFDKKSIALAAKIKANQEKAAAAKASANVKGAKDANPKSSKPPKDDAPRAVTSGDEDDEAPAPRVASVRPQQRKKKKGRR
jgi:membrane protein insertase Oxa1/YidC/SpoIIIJ